MTLATPAERAQWFVRWLGSATDVEDLTIPAEWLLEPEPAIAVDALVSELAAEQKAERRGFFRFFRRRRPSAAPMEELVLDDDEAVPDETPKKTGELKKITGMLDPEVIKAKDQERQKRDDEGSLRDLL
jgi:hypothetical protein